MNSVPLGSQNTVEFTASLPFSQHSRLTANTAYELTQDFVRILRHREGEQLDGASTKQSDS